MDTKKRLSDWTLAECKEFCEKRKDKNPIEVNDQKTGVTTTMWNYFCGVCELANMCGCRPANWKFYTLTDGEKAIMRACGAKWVTKDVDVGNCVILWRTKPEIRDGIYEADEYIGHIDESLFPSLFGGDCIELED